MEKPFVNIHADSTVLTLADSKNLTLAVGYRNLSEDYFHSSLPSVYEIETAIITIEDELQKIDTAWTKSDTVYAKHNEFIDIAQFLMADKWIMQQQLEFGFNRVADVIMGSPKRCKEFPDEVEFVSKLLILREVMHHLEIDKIRLL